VALLGDYGTGTEASRRAASKILPNSVAVLPCVGFSRRRTLGADPARSQKGRERTLWQLQSRSGRSARLRRRFRTPWVDSFASPGPLAGETTRSPADVHSVAPDPHTSADRRSVYDDGATRPYTAGTMHASCTDHGIRFRAESHCQKHNHETKCQILHFGPRSATRSTAIGRGLSGSSAR
jgi:hypothetical protein